MNAKHAKRLYCPSCQWTGWRAYVAQGDPGVTRERGDGYGVCPVCCGAALVPSGKLREARRVEKARRELAELAAGGRV